MVTWFFTRHVAYVIVCYSVWKDTPVLIPSSCFTGASESLVGPIPVPSGISHYVEPFVNPQGLVCWDDTIRWSFLSVLSFLQVLTLVWFFMIIRVAVKVIKGTGATDSRSDDEAEDGEEFEYAEAEPLEEEVGIEDIDLHAWERRAGVKRQSSTGVSLPGHSDRRELLGRIGCEKQVD